MTVVRRDPDVVRVIIAWQAWKMSHEELLSEARVCSHSRSLFAALDRLSEGSEIPAGPIIDALIELEGGEPA